MAQQLIYQSGGSPSTVKLTWKGDEVLSRARRAEQRALEEVANACVSLSSLYAPVDTGFLASTMDHGEVFQDSRDVLAIEWGNWDADYALWQEIGTSRFPGRYFMQQAADEEYPQLEKLIKDYMR